MEALVASLAGLLAFFTWLHEQRQRVTDKRFENRRVIRDVDDAIKKYEDLSEKQEVKVKPFYFSEKVPDGSKAQELLGGELRICAPWVSDCPKFEYN